MAFIISLLLIYVVYRIVKKISTQKELRKISEINSAIKIFEMAGHGSVNKTKADEWARVSNKGVKWYGYGQGINIQGYHIPHGLIYVGSLSIYDSENDACIINPTLKVTSSESSETDEKMEYWSQYRYLSVKCRGAYLAWLAGGRSDPDVDIGCVFLFFYGLERRLFLDGQQTGVSKEERLKIIEEVKRLLAIYGDNRSFRGYANNLLAMEWVFHQSDQPIPSYIDFTDRYCLAPFQVILAQYVAAGKPIPSDIALQWINLHPEFGLKTPARRCAKEFKELFAHQYKQRFGDGLVIKPNKTLLKLEYRSANPSLWNILKPKATNLPHPFVLAGPLKKINALVEECTTKLEPYSRYLGRKGNDPNSWTALSLLPKELMNQTLGIDKMKTYLAQVCAEGPSIVPVVALYEKLGEKCPVSLDKRGFESLAVLIEKIGFGIVPDVRFYNIKPKLGGEMVVFPHGHGIDFQPSAKFFMMSTILHLGSIISQVDQNVSATEEAVLQGLIQNSRELTAIEKDSLMAFLYWCLRTPQDVAGLKQKLSGISIAEKAVISHALISVAQADGYIDPKEVSLLEKLYPMLGLNKEQAISDIHTLATANEPVVISLRDSSRSFSIPNPIANAEQSRGFYLNEELVKMREEETRRVKSVLEGIFSDQTEEEVDTDVSSVVMSVGGALTGLDQAHQDLFSRLLAQEAWSRSALQGLCKELGLMVDGAMEVLNEWAFDRANAPLLEDGEPIYVDVNLAKEITNA